jgi:hypothetical protein
VDSGHLSASADESAILWRLALINADRFQRDTADRTADPPEVALLRVCQLTGARGWMHLDLPHDFVGHPVANSRENGLIKQHGLDR